MQSPIRFPMDGLEASIFTIAPERKHESEATLNNFDLIYLSARPLAHYSFYTRLIAGRNFEEPVNIDSRSDATVSKSLYLLKWAIECQLNSSLADDWPDGLPRPLENPVANSDEWVADELCRAACSCILHHEIAHVVLQNHSDANDEQSISQEKDADIAAAEWLLGG